MSGPLDGIRIIDFTTMIAGPYGTMILADQGADVIKVEAPVASNHARRAGYAQRHFSAAFVNNNRNKRSIAIDVKQPEGLRLLLKLVETADVFVQNFRPGVMQRLKIDEPELRCLNPSLIYVSLSGWGERGPWSHKPVYDPIIQAISGLTSIQAGSDEDRPRLIRTILPDKLTGITGSQAVVSALFARERTGEGQHVRLSMLDSIVSFLWSSDMGSQTFVGKEVDVARAATFIDLIYETTTDYIGVSVMTNTQWVAFCTAVDRTVWLEDARFKTPSGRDKFADQRLELMQDVLLKKSAKEWLDLFETAVVPCAPVLKRHEMIHHPQVVASEVIVETEHKYAGRLRQSRNAARFEGTPTEIRYGAPHLGEHTRELMGELQFSESEICAMEAAGSIAVYPSTTS